MASATAEVEKFLKQMQDYERELRLAKSMAVKVGLPEGKVGGAVYDNGQSVIDVGVRHEYGIGTPRRSFLRVPFLQEADAIDARLTAEFRAVK